MNLNGYIKFQALPNTGLVMTGQGGKNIGTAVLLVLRKVLVK